MALSRTFGESPALASCRRYRGCNVGIRRFRPVQRSILPDSNSFSGFNRVFKPSPEHLSPPFQRRSMRSVSSKRIPTRSPLRFLRRKLSRMVSRSIWLSKVFRPEQPLKYAGNGPYADSFFTGTHNPFHSGGFYSVHAMSAFSIATVIAHRFRAASLGPVGRIRHGRRNRLPDYKQQPFPFRRILRRSHRLRDHAVRKYTCPMKRL